MSGERLSSKVLRFETFLNEKLKPDLLAVLKERDDVYENIADYLALKNTLKTINESQLRSKEPLKSQVDLGCNFYVECVVNDYSKLLVDVGLGIFVELEYTEAVDFLEKKVSNLENRANSLTDQACGIKANIKLTLGGLQELQDQLLHKDQK